MNSTFVCKFRLDFCGCAKFFPLHPLYNNGPTSKFTAKAAPETLPQQIQLMKLLQVPTANLEERIKEEMEENPALGTIGRRS